MSAAAVLVIDDGSTDGTAAAAQAAGALVLRLPYNLGIGGAVQAGFKFACRRGMPCRPYGRETGSTIRPICAVCCKPF
ncbi:glycosyltransferase [Candidatus Amarolinea dominans]|uniref:glycosyltransferase n=1 Tax=Candidatus Amarolinea dominans TaxID=3140696 RepID=UPI003134F996|nr:glycosyltransferase [Anaerolineae bacterium]